MKISFKQETKRSFTFTCEPLAMVKRGAEIIWALFKACLGI
jgi:hypothetical protein